MSKRNPLGSREWLERVFASGPTRDPNGRSRPTQRYLTNGTDDSVLVAEGDTVVYVWNATGTHDGPLALPSGAVPPTGKRGVVPGTLIATVKDGKIIR